MYRFNLDKNSNFFGAKMENLTLKFIWNSKNPQIAKTKFKKNTAGRLTLLDLKNYFAAIVIKTEWCWYKPDIDTSGVEERVQK